MNQGRKMFSYFKRNYKKQSVIKPVSFFLSTVILFDHHCNGFRRSKYWISRQAEPGFEPDYFRTWTTTRDNYLEWFNNIYRGHLEDKWANKV